jgi:putative phosphoribosyl transferase
MNKKLFFDRYDAGKQLAKKLKSYSNSDAVVLALPRGGVLVGYEIATHLHLPLDVIITRKIGHPLNREVAVCAITEDGRRVCDDGGLYGLDESWIAYEVAVAMDEAVRRRKLFGADRAVSLAHKTVIVTDDGIATGLTMKAALLMIRSQKPKKIVLAIPVCPAEVLQEFRDQVDEIVRLDSGANFRGAVGAYYTHFPEVYDTEVIACLKSSKKTAKKFLVPARR